MSWAAWCLVIAGGICLLVTVAMAYVVVWLGKQLRLKNKTVRDLEDLNRQLVYEVQSLTPKNPRRKKQTNVQLNATYVIHEEEYA